MIQVYTDSTYLTQEFRKIIFPVLLDIHFTKSEIALENFQITETIEKAHVVVVPVAINYFFKHKKLKELNQFIDQAIALHKLVWVYSAGDYGITFRKDVIVFRLGGFQSKLTDTEEILPSFVSDAYINLHSTPWQPLQKTFPPKIGFVGQANSSVLKIIKEWILHYKVTFSKFFDKSLGDFQSFYPSSYIRYKILKKVSTSEKIVSDFILRKVYRAGVKTENEKQKTTLEFFQNIENNLYTICIRGAGNFSVRLYETLMMGRIPVVVFSDAKMPLDHYINWKKHIVFTNKKDVVKDVIAFHNTISNDSLIEMQKNNRDLMLGLLQRVNYFKKIYELRNEF